MLLEATKSALLWHRRLLQRSTTKEVVVEVAMEVTDVVMEVLDRTGIIMVGTVRALTERGLGRQSFYVLRFVVLCL